MSDFLVGIVTVPQIIPNPPHFVLAAGAVNVKEDGPNYGSGAIPGAKGTTGE